MIQILIAEDQTILREALSSLLNLEDDMAVIGTVGTGEEVLQFPNIEEVDVFLLDIEMPNGTGLEIAAQLRKKYETCKIALLTTFSRSGYIEQAMKIGVHGYFLKDEPIEQLTKAIRRVSAGEKVISPLLSDLLFSLKSNPLNEREQEMLRRIRDGESTSAIAKTCHLSIGTVRNYISSAMQKLETATRHDALKKAEDNGWI